MLRRQFGNSNRTKKGGGHMKNKDVRKALRLLKSRNRLKRLQTPRILKDNYDDEAAHRMIDALKTEPDFDVQLEMVNTIRHWLEGGHRPDNAVTVLIAMNPRLNGPYVIDRKSTRLNSSHRT